MVAPTPLDDVQSIARIAGFAARVLLARARPDSAKALARAFRRDLSVFGFCVGGLDALGVPHRSARGAVPHLPGRVVVLGGRDADGPEAAQVHDLLDRGGTVVAEGASLATVEPAKRLRKSGEPSATAVAVTGPAVDRLLPAAIAPLFWIDDDTRAPGRKGLDVDVATARGFPLVSRWTSRGGTFVHFATAVAPWRRAAPPDAPRTTPAAFAELAELPAEGPLAEREATVPDALFRATLTMLLVIADAVGAALGRTGS